MPTEDWTREVTKLIAESFGANVGLDEKSPYHIRVNVFPRGDDRENFNFDLFRNGAGVLRLGEWRPSDESPDVKSAVERLIQDSQPRGNYFGANQKTEDQLTEMKNVFSSRGVGFVAIQFEQYRFRLNFEHAKFGRGSGTIYFRKSGLNSDTWTNETCGPDLFELIRTVLQQVAPPRSAV